MSYPANPQQSAGQPGYPVPPTAPPQPYQNQQPYPAQPQQPQPGYPQQPYAQQYAPAAAPGYAPQPQAPSHYVPDTAYTQPYPGQFPQPQFQPPVPPRPQVHASIDDFYNQPTSSGKFISFANKQPGYRISGIVARPVTPADIRQQTDINNPAIGLVHRDGAPRLEMIIPLTVAKSPEFPDGTAAWAVKGKSSNELKRDVAEAGGDPNQPPPAGSLIDITFLGKQPVPGRSAANVVQVTYTPPGKFDPQQVLGEQAQPQFQQQFAQPPVYGNGQYGEYQQAQFPPNAAATPQPQQVQQFAQPQFQQPQFQQPQFQQPQAQQAQQVQQFAQPQQAQQAPPQQQQQQPAPPDGLSADQQQLLARLTGGQ